MYIIHVFAVEFAIYLHQKVCFRNVLPRMRRENEALDNLSAAEGRVAKLEEMLESAQTMWPQELREEVGWRLPSLIWVGGFA